MSFLIICNEVISNIDKNKNISKLVVYLNPINAAFCANVNIMQSINQSTNQ